jgi:hypothetical protein
MKVILCLNDLLPHKLSSAPFSRMVSILAGGKMKNWLCVSLLIFSIETWALGDSEFIVTTENCKVIAAEGELAEALGNEIRFYVNVSVSEGLLALGEGGIIAFDITNIDANILEAISLAGSHYERQYNLKLKIVRNIDYSPIPGKIYSGDLEEFMPAFPQYNGRLSFNCE